MNKATHERIELWQPVVKTSNGKYIAVLSDDSLDRDGEIVGKQALQGIMENDGYTAMLLNHKNDVMGQIGEWVNKRIETINGHTAFIAEPKFYMSNPNAKIIKGSLDEGAKFGISIGAIPKAFEYIEKSGEKIKMYTDLELLEASWVAIPSNRHGMAMAVAKMFSDKEDKMEEKTFTQKDLDDAVEKSGASTKEELEKANTEVVEKLTTEHEESVEKAKVEHTEAIKKITTENEEAVEKMVELHKSEVDKLTVKLDELEKMSVLKGDLTTDEKGDGTTTEDVAKAIKDGKMPVVSK